MNDFKLCECGRRHRGNGAKCGDCTQNPVTKVEALAVASLYLQYYLSQQSHDEHISRLRAVVAVIDEIKVEYEP